MWLSGSYPSSIEHNRTVLNALREEQRSAVREFLEANRTLLEEIAAEIDLKELLGLPEMLPYFSRVVFTGRMQKNVGTP